MRILGISLGGSIIAATLVAIVAVHPPVYAASALARIESAVSCATTAACVTGTNSSSGPGVSGTSSKGYGVEGVSTSNDGLKGISTSSNGLSASSTSSYGVKGESSTSYGVYASSTYATGILGQTASTQSAAQAGILGKDISKNGGMNTGVLGMVGNGGYGVAGYSSDNGAGGVLGSATTGVGVYGYSKDVTAIYAESPQSYSLFAQSSGLVGLAVQNTNTEPNIPVFQVLDSRSQIVFAVDNEGNVTQNGMPFTNTRSKSGNIVQSFTTRSSMPNTEDFGTGQLRNGAASVALDATFADSIDLSAPYRVYITPDGDTRGLYVASKSANSFVVREAQGGRSDASFDYRIVAVATGQTGKRMKVIPRPALAQVPSLKASSNFLKH